MSNHHYSWAEVKEGLLRKMTASDRAEFLRGTARGYEELRHETWVCQVEDWLRYAVEQVEDGEPYLHIQGWLDMQHWLDDQEWTPLPGERTELSGD